MILDGRTLQSTPESGARAGYENNNGSKAHIAVNKLQTQMVVHVTAANE